MPNQAAKAAREVEEAAREVEEAELRWRPAAAAAGAAGAATSSAGVVVGGKAMEVEELHAACHRGNTDEVCRLLHRGADVNERNRKGLVPLHAACMRGAGNPRCVEVLLEAGATVDAVSDSGCTPLTVACIWRKASCAALLVAAGASIRVKMPARLGGQALMEWAAHVHQRQKPESKRYNGAAPMVLRALHWSPDTHPLFPPGARAHAVQLVLLGFCMSHRWSVPLDMWIQLIMPIVMQSEW